MMPWFWSARLGDNPDAVLKAWAADASVIADFLNDMDTLDTTAKGREVAAEQRDPQQWGKLVLSRAHEAAMCWPSTPSPTGMRSTITSASTV